jgi:hypothetical protein
MKLKTLSVAVGVAAASWGTSAFAVDVHLSSASALRDTMSRAISQYCAPGGTIYERSATKGVANPGSSPSDRDFRMYECTTKVGNADLDSVGLSGTALRIFHTVKVNAALGGSIVGVAPIYKAIDMEFVDPASTCGTPGGASATTVIAGYTWNVKRCNGSFGKRPDIGVSDTEPASFTGVNLPGDEVVLDASSPSLDTAAEVAGWKSGIVADANIIPQQMFAVGFGFAATKTLINAGVTNATLSQLQSLLAGGIDDWGVVSSALAGNAVKICRRTKGSGTQASFNAFINNNPCLTAPGIGGALPVADASATGPLGGLTVVENAATSGVKTCLENANTNGEYAIGLLSLENNEVATGWQFLAVDGVAPFQNPETVADGVSDRIKEDALMNGSYPLYQEPTIQWNAATIGADQAKFAALARDFFGTPEIASALPGIVALPKFWSIKNATDSVAYPLPKTFPLDTTKHIMHYSRGGNSCQPSSYNAF